MRTIRDAEGRVIGGGTAIDVDELSEEDRARLKRLFGDAWDQVIDDNK